MEQIFIRVKHNGEWVDKDIKNTTYEERFKYYINISHGNMADIIEKLLKFRGNK